MVSVKSACAKFLAMALLIVCSAVYGQAGAQSLIQPPAIASTDQNGVDLTSGKYTPPDLNVDIGASGSGLARIAGLNGSDNNTGIMKLTTVPYYYPVAGQTQAPGQTNAAYLYVDASVGGATYRFLIFNATPGANPNLTNNGFYLTSSGVKLDCDGVGTPIYTQSGACRLILGDGTIAVYDRTLSSGGQWGGLTSVTKPDGEVLTYSYYLVGSEVKAIKSVSSTLGWMLKYEVDGNYKVTKVTAINSSVAYCDPQATSCAVSSSFPYGTVTTSGATTTIARNGTNIVSFTISGNVVTITSPTGVTKTVTYSGTDTSGRVASVSSGGSTWNYSYTTDNNGAITQTVVTAPNGTTRKLAVGPYGIAAQTDEAGRVTNYVYDTNTGSTSFGKVLQVIAPDGNAATGGFVAYTYDPRGNVTGTLLVPKNGATNGIANAGAAVFTQAFFPTSCDLPTAANSNYRYCNKPTYVIDANGVRTDYTYDPAHGGLLTETKPAINGIAAQTRYTYSQLTPQLKNASGALVAQAAVWRLTSTSSCRSQSSCTGQADEQKTVLAYTSTNLLPYSTTVSLGDGSLPQTTTIDYTDNGWVAAADGPKPGTVDKVYKFYDALGRAVGAIGIDPDGAGARNRPATRTVYDEDSRAIEVDTGTASGTDATALANMVIQERDTNTFNSVGLPTVAMHFIGSSTTPKDVTQRSYDNMLRVTCEATRLNPTDYASLPTSACTLGTTNPDGSHDRIVQNNYDPVTGGLLSTVSGYGTSIAHVNAVKFYDTTGATSTGNLLYVEDANGNRTSYFYDSFNRLIKTCYPLAGTTHASSTTDCEQQAYRTTGVTGTSQANSLVSTVTLRDSATIGFNYDGLGRVSSKSGAVIESYTYDNFSQVLTHTNNTTGGAAVTETYGYNALGWLMSDQQPMGTVSYGYDAYGKRTQMTYPGGGLYITYAYDDGDELTGIFENGSTSISSFSYDDYGRRTSLGRGNNVPTGYGYDSSLRLGSITQGTSGASFFNQVTYGYTPADQIASKTATNTAYNYTPAAKSTTYSIDGLNRVSAVSGTSLAYDARGNMTSDGGGSYVYNANNLLTSATQSGVTSTLTYDAENRLLSIAKNGTTTQFLYDGVDMVAEYNASGTLLRRYVHGPGDDEPLVWYEGAGTGTKYYLGADDLGSVSVLTNGSGGQYAINTYDEYGLPGSGNTGRFQYTGQIYLPEVGLYYYKARLYNPVLGRFMQTDPIGYGDGMNWYAYVGNDPINGVDPTGEDCANPQSQDEARACQQQQTSQQEQQNQQNSTDPCSYGGDDCVVTVVGQRPDHGSCGNGSVLNQIGCWGDRIAQYTVPGYDFGKCVGGLLISSLNCNGQQWLGATASGVADIALIAVGGPVAKVGLKLAEKVGVKALEFVAERGVKSGFCFTAGTQVATPTDLKNIEDIKVGDLVLSYDEQTGAIVAKPVTQLIRNPPQATYEVKVKSADGITDSVRATAEHPWLMASHQWAGTSTLHAKDHIESATGEDLTVISVKATGKVEPIYNFTVADTHTYLVGKNHAVVHNSCGGVFDAAGKLTEDAIKGSREIMSRAKMGDTSIPAGFNKYATKTFSTVSGDAQVHFLMNPNTGEILYDYTYKTVANSQKF